MKKFIKLIVMTFSVLLSSGVYAQYTKADCQEKVNSLREMYISILRKMPLMPPLAQLSGGIQRALDEGERNRDLGNYGACVQETERSIQIVQGYAK